MPRETTGVITIMVKIKHYYYYCGVIIISLVLLHRGKQQAKQHATRHSTRASMASFEYGFALLRLYYCVDEVSLYHLTDDGSSPTCTNQWRDGRIYFVPRAGPRYGRILGFLLRAMA